MNKKGFTLIELIAVIIVLAAITLLAIPPIISSVNKNKETISETSKKLVFSAIDIYIDDYLGIPSVPEDTKVTICIPITKLVQYKLLDSKIYDEDNQTGISMTDVVKVSLYNGTKEKDIVSDGDCRDGYEYIQSVTSEGGPYYVRASGKTYKGIAYLNPKDLSVECDETNSQIGTGEANPSGCMRFYVYDDSGVSYKMILDHNTTAKASTSISFNDDGTNVAVDDLATYLSEDTKGWAGNPRLMTGEEIATITNTTTYNGTRDTWFYFAGTGTKKQTQASMNQGANPYAWLFDYTYACTSCGCNTADSSTNGYWTASPAELYPDLAPGDSHWWFVDSFDRCGSLMHVSLNNSHHYGIRPVITLPKSIFKDGLL